MSPRCPECNQILVGIRATADGPQAQPCDCDLSETVVDELRSPFVDRGHGVATDGGLPAWAERTDDGRIRCTVCENEADELPVEHDCIYANDLVADGGTIVGDPAHPSETASPHTEEESQ